jgi:hypothetical protein
MMEQTCPFMILYILAGGKPTPLKNDGVCHMGVLFPIYGKS